MSMDTVLCSGDTALVLYGTVKVSEFDAGSTPDSHGIRPGIRSSTILGFGSSERKGSTFNRP